MTISDDMQEARERTQALADSVKKIAEDARSRMDGFDSDKETAEVTLPDDSDSSPSGKPEAAG